MIGQPIHNYWEANAQDSRQLVALLKDLAKNGQGWIINRSLELGYGVTQVLLSLFIPFTGKTPGVWLTASRETSRLIRR